MALAAAFDKILMALAALDKTLKLAALVVVVVVMFKDWIYWLLRPVSSKATADVGDGPGHDHQAQPPQNVQPAQPPQNVQPAQPPALIPLVRSPDCVVFD